MSRTNDVNIAMQYAKSGVDGVHLMDSHKATIGWVVNTLAAEVERLETDAKAMMIMLRGRGELVKRAEAATARVAVADQSIDELQAALNTQQARVAELEEFRIMQLAAISTATLQNTVKSTADRISPGSPYSTVAYVDVCKAVDREMRERQRAEAAEAWVKELEAQNARLRAALESEYRRVAPVIVNPPVRPWEHLGGGRMLGTWAEDGSPYHFSIPFQLVPAFLAMQRLAGLTKRPAPTDGKAALNGEEAGT